MPRPVSLRARTLGLVGGALLVLLAVHYLGLRYAFVRAIAGLEQNSVTQQAGQVRSELFDALEDLDGVAADYASWDKTYSYVVDRNPEFVESDLADEALRHLRLEAALVIDAKGHIVLMRTLLPPEDAARLREELAVHLAAGSPLTMFADLEKGVRGFVRLPSRSLGLATRPILTSDGEGPPRGTMLMARRLDGLVTTARDTMQVTLDVAPLPTILAPPLAALPRTLSTDTVDVSVVTRDRVDGIGVLRDIYDRPQWQTRISIDRSLHREAERWFAYFVLALILSAIVVAGVTLVLLDRHVLRRLTEVSRVVADIGTTGSLSRRLHLQGGDELADVGTAIDSMLGRIEASQHALEESEQRYRMAEQSALEAARVKAEFLANMSHESGIL